MIEETKQPNQLATGREPKPKSFDAWIQIGLFAIAGLCVIAAVAHAICPARVDQTTALFLGLAAAVLIIREISKLEFAGVKLERIRQELKEDVRQVVKKVDAIEEGADLPGRPTEPRAGAPPAVKTAEMAAVNNDGNDGAQGNDEDDTWDSDPNRGKFGGSPQSNGRVLEATIEPMVGEISAACNVHISVRSTDPTKPLKGKVRFYLHPTFRKWKEYDVKVRGGVAEDDFTSWGVFTVGAVADDGETKLELNLNDVPGGTRKFYRQ